MERKVVITGMGIWSCLGKTLEDVRDSLYTGKSGIIFSQERKDAGFRSALCADVERPDLKPFIPRNLRHFMPRRKLNMLIWPHGRPSKMQSWIKIIWTEMRSELSMETTP